MLQISVNDKRTFDVSKDGDDWLLDENPVNADIQLQPNGLISILYNNKSYTGVVENVDLKTKELTVVIDGYKRQITISEPMDLLLESMGLDMSALQKAEPVRAPMPGMVLKVLVEQGQQISKGDALLVLEAMKMENVLKATADATVKAVNATELTAVEKGAVLIELE